MIDEAIRDYLTGTPGLAKLDALDWDLDREFAAARELSRRGDSIRAGKDKAARRLEQFVRTSTGGQFGAELHTLDPESNIVAYAVARMEHFHPGVCEKLLSEHRTAQSEFERHNDLVARVSAKIEPIGALKERVVTYVWGILHSGPPRLHKADEAALRKAIGTNPASTVEKAGAQVAELKAALHEVASAPPARSEILDAAKAYVDALAARGTPDVVGFVESGGTHPVRFAEAITGRQYPPIDPVALIAWLDRDRLTERLAAACVETIGDEEGITREERAARTSDLRRQILATERLEEAATIAAIEAGHTITRRPDLDPRVFLELADDMRASRDRD